MNQNHLQSYLNHSGASQGLNNLKASNNIKTINNNNSITRQFGTDLTNCSNLPHKPLSGITTFEENCTQPSTVYNEISYEINASQNDHQYRLMLELCKHFNQ